MTRPALATRWPRKTREIIDVHRDSTAWNRFRFREGDVVIANWAKSGCTWLQQIVGQLIFAGSASIPVARMSPWVDLGLASQDMVLARLEAQTHRRFVKTHLPVDALVYSPQARYLYIGRDGRDVAWSAYNHFRRLSPDWYSMMRKSRSRFGRVPDGPPDSFRAFFRQWLDEDGFPFWPFWESLQSWWEIRTLPNLMLLHFAELRDNLPGTVRRIAAFLEIPVRDDVLPVILEHCSLEYMRKTANRIVPNAAFAFEGGAQVFFGGGGRAGWRAELSEGDLAYYASIAQHRLEADCVAWLHGAALTGAS